MEKTTRSPILCEAKDFVTGLYDAEGRMLEQTENLPILAFSLAPVCKYLVEYFGDDLHEAMSVQDSDEVAPNAVIMVVQKGSQLNGRLVRPARVIVARS